MNIYGNTLNRNFTSAVHEEAMAAIGDIAIVIGSRFCNYLPVASMMIQVGLTDGHQHPNLCNVAVLVLGDVATACKEKLAEHSDDFITLLLKNLAEPELIFELKPRVVETLGDVAVALGSQFEKYIQVVMKYLLEAGSSNPGENPSQDTMTQINLLRAAVLHCIINMFDAMKTRKQHIVCFYPEIPRMLMAMNQVFPSKKVVYLSCCCLEDMVTVSPMEGIAVIAQHQQFFENFLNSCMQDSNKDTKSTSMRLQKRVMQYAQAHGGRSR
jgi:importin subunit beta-1